MSHHDPVLPPRRDGERHLPDGTMPSSSELNRTESEDLETLRIMQEAGFDSSMSIDPSSLKALQELLATPKRSQRKSLNNTQDSKKPAVPNLVTEVDGKEQASFGTRSAAAALAHVPSEVLRPIALGRVTSDLTMGLRSEMMMEEDTDASTAGSTQRGTASNTDKRILDQLQMQTALLIDLQRRVDELTNIVLTQQGQLQQQQGGGFVPPQMMHVNQTGGNQQQQRTPNIPPPQQPRNVPPPPEQAQRQMFLFGLIASIPTYIRSTRVAEMCRVYWALHRRDMRGRIDFNLIIKILFMGAILMAKFSASHKRRKSDSSAKSTFQAYVLVLLVVGGFLFQSGYVRFLQNFFIKERYIQRIWAGEVIDIAAQQPPRARAEQRRERQAPQEEGDDGANEENDDGPGLLRGAIRQPAPGGFVGKVIMDVVYLFGSFLLSILPMWKAEAQQPRRDARVAANRRPNNGEQQNEGGADGAE